MSFTVYVPALQQKKFFLADPLLDKVNIFQQIYIKLCSRLKALTWYANNNKKIVKNC